MGLAKRDTRPLIYRGPPTGVFTYIKKILLGPMVVRIIAHMYRSTSILAQLIFMISIQCTATDVYTKFSTKFSSLKENCTTKLVTTQVLNLATKFNKSVMVYEIIF